MKCHDVSIHSLGYDMNTKQMFSALTLLVWHLVCKLFHFSNVSRTLGLTCIQMIYKKQQFKFSNHQQYVNWLLITHTVSELNINPSLQLDKSKHISYKTHSIHFLQLYGYLLKYRTLLQVEVRVTTSYNIKQNAPLKKYAKHGNTKYRQKFPVNHVASKHSVWSFNKWCFQSINQ